MRNFHTVGLELRVHRLRDSGVQEFSDVRVWVAKEKLLGF